MTRFLLAMLNQVEAFLFATVARLKCRSDGHAAKHTPNCTRCGKQIRTVSGTMPGEIRYR